MQYAKPNSGIGFPGALELVTEVYRQNKDLKFHFPARLIVLSIYNEQCKSNGLKVAVASSADRIKVEANLAAAGLPLSM